MLERLENDWGRLTETLGVNELASIRGAAAPPPPPPLEWDHLQANTWKLRILYGPFGINHSVVEKKFSDSLGINPE